MTNANQSSKMDCKESLSLMSAAVDGELHEPKLSEFLEHIRVCEACRAEFEAEKATKAILKSRLKRVKAPKSLVDAIKRQTIGNPSMSQFSQFSSLSPAALPQQEVHRADSWYEMLSSWLFVDTGASRRANSFFAAGLAFTVLAMLIFAGFVRTNSETGLFDTARTVVHSAAPNLCEIIAFTFDPKQERADMHTSEAQVVENYFAKIAGIQAVIPKVKGFSLATARLTALGSLNAGEIVFKNSKGKKNAENAESVVAVYVINEKDMQGRLTVPHEVMQAISADGRCFRTMHTSQGHQVVVWKWGEIIYAATTHDAQLDLAQLITNPNWN